MGPDDTKVELVENKGMPGAIALHHIHFAASNVKEMQAWYAKTFNAKPGTRGSFQAADLPGVNLTYSPAPEAVVATRGRSLDHIGFEVKDLENFVKQLEASGSRWIAPTPRCRRWACRSHFSPIPGEPTSSSRKDSPPFSRRSANVPGRPTR